jgi:hypothetical protein
MIVKALDPLSPDANKLVQAGRRAEDQMAFYLRRAFGENPKVQVINGLRLERQGEVAQIDHLVISNHGFILIESKSVTSQIQVNAQGEWARQVNSAWQGMPSPLLQAERQAKLLRALLNDHVDDFFPKLLGLQFTFNKSVPFDVLVAISDRGMIQRPPGFATDQVLKADQITGRVQEINEKYRRASSLLSFKVKDLGAEFGDAKVSRLAQFLLERHTPQPNPVVSPSAQLSGVASATRQRTTSQTLGSPAVAKPQPQSAPLPKPSATSAKPAPGATPLPKPKPASAPSPVSPAAVEAAPTCRSCGSQNLSILYGKYGYYFKCGDCEGNTPIKATCTNGEKAKIRKQGREFFAESFDGKESRLFYVNPEI